MFPDMVRIVRQGSFHSAKSLRVVALSESMEMLGTNSCKPNGDTYPSVFEDSGLEHIKLPFTLNIIEQRTFMKYERLKAVKFPNRLEYIGNYCFAKTGFESVVIPSSVKTNSGCAFEGCKYLRHV